MMSRRRRAYVRKHRQQFGGVYLDPRSHIWYYRRMVSGKRQLTRIGKLSEYPTKALAKRASQSLIADAPKPASPTFENAARRYMTHRMPTQPPDWGRISQSPRKLLHSQVGRSCADSPCRPTAGDRALARQSKPRTEDQDPYQGCHATGV